MEVSLNIFCQLYNSFGSFQIGDYLNLYKIIGILVNEHLGTFKTLLNHYQQNCFLKIMSMFHFTECDVLNRGPYSRGPISSLSEIPECHGRQ